MRIEELSDFPALQQLAHALWRRGTARGAGVLVGAGFSRNADLSGADSAKPPLWPDIAQALAAQLYPNSNSEARPEPLRLAEEYRTYFGQAALDEFIRTRIRDDAWRPGPLHRALLELPWADVLTTNWDTLLERTARSITAYDYEPVRTTADLAHARAPRIVKLHGSLGTSEHFIIAEEDYRTYPARFAAFVNLARQIFVENELCLIGFSGDDPNFLQWSGWVRDHLNDSARRIYLVGPLQLGPPKRKLLEARNVAPIDLAPLVEGYDPDNRHAIAMKSFLDFLAKSEPKAIHTWTPANPNHHSLGATSPDEWERRLKDPDHAARLLEKVAEVWRKDRESYPGWLICPPGERSNIQCGTGVVPRPNEAALAKLALPKRAAVLYELSWRHAIAFQPIDDYFASLLSTIADPAIDCGLEKRQQLEVAAVLLRTARETDVDQAFARWADVLDRNTEAGSDLRAEAAYQRCLRARDRLDFVGIAATLEGVAGPDPVWRLRQAALRFVRGESRKAAELIAEALAELRERQRDDRGSLWVRSRRAWAEWLMLAVRRDDFSVQRDEKRWPLEYTSSRCDPWDEVNGFRVTAEKALRERREKSRKVIPLFEPGHYRNPSNTITFGGSAEAVYAYELDRLIETAGLPVRLNYVNLFSDTVKHNAEICFEPTVSCYFRLLRSIYNVSDPIIDRYFGRISVAQLPGLIVEVLSERVRGAIDFWWSKIRTGGDQVRVDIFIEQLRLFVEILGRLTPRQDAHAVHTSFEVALALARDASLTHPLLFEALGNLLHFSAKATPPEDRADLFLSMLEFPLSNEKKADPNRGGWPDPTEPFWNIPIATVMRDARWDGRVKQLILAASAKSPSRPEAVTRIACLARHNLLTAEEKSSFGEALWSEKDSETPSLPARTGLLPHVLADLPAPTGIDKEALLRARIFEGDVKNALAFPASGNSSDLAAKKSLVLGIVAAGQASLRPNRKQAINIFDAMTSWRPSDLGPEDGLTNPLSTFFLRDFEAFNRRTIGQALTYVVVPSIALEDRTEDRAQALLELIEDGTVTIAIGALAYFAKTKTEEIIVQRIGRCIVGRNMDEVVGATLAIEAWAKLDCREGFPNLPPRLVEKLVSTIEARRRVGLARRLACARTLIELNSLTKDQEAQLCASLDELTFELSYDQIDLEQTEAVTISLERAQCVRLAQRLSVCPERY